MREAAPDECVYRTPAIPRPRGVEDAAPYGGCETFAAAWKATDAVTPRVPMERGLRPRYYIRWTVEVTVRTVGNTGAIGHASHPRQRCPSGHTTAAHRGWCALRAVAKRTLRHMTQLVWKAIPKLPTHLMAPLKHTLSQPP